MNLGFKIFIYIIIIAAVLFGGYLLGRISSAREVETASSQAAQSDSATQDLLIIANLYGSILSLTEQKHLADLNGDSVTTAETNKQINELLGRVNALLEKYSNSINTESY